MKLTIPPANKLKGTEVKRREHKLEAIVAYFLNGAVKQEIIAASSEGGKSINIAIPTEAYGEDNKKFYALCASQLKPLGYKAEQSHDGGGMYSTLCVTWK